MQNLLFFLSSSNASFLQFYFVTLSQGLPKLIYEKDLIGTIWPSFTYKLL